MTWLSLIYVSPLFSWRATWKGVTSLGSLLRLLQPEVIGTACSGSGAPVHALAELIGQSNYMELFASENHVPCFIRHGSVDACKIMTIRRLMFWTLTYLNFRTILSIIWYWIWALICKSSGRDAQIYPWELQGPSPIPRHGFGKATCPSVGLTLSENTWKTHCHHFSLTPDVLISSPRI